MAARPLAAYSLVRAVHLSPESPPLMFVSGTTARQADGTIPPFPLSSGDLGPGKDAAQLQMELICDKIQSSLQAASGGTAGLEDILDATIFLTNLQRDYAAVNEVWDRRIARIAERSDATTLPARTCVQVALLPPNETALVEVKCTALSRKSA